MIQTHKDSPKKKRYTKYDKGAANNICNNPMNVNQSDLEWINIADVVTKDDAKANA
jgi:hypothetical protein